MSLNWNPKILLVRSLAETLYWAKKCYYDGHYARLGFSISDESYDKLEQQMKLLCPEHPILHCVGSPDMDVLIGMADTRKLVEPQEVDFDGLLGSVEGEDLLG